MEDVFVIKPINAKDERAANIVVLILISEEYASGCRRM
jgi:hypothetical protein